MGSVLARFSNVIATTLGGFIGTLIFPGVGTVIGGLALGIPVFIFNYIKGNDGGPLDIGYSGDGFYAGYCNETALKKVKNFMSIMARDD